jgi:hypothetical protein
MAGPNVAHQRRQQALKLLGEGFGCTELTAKLSGEWGCSRRQARRYVAGAYSEMVDDLEHVEASDMLAQLVNRLEQVARLAIESGQHGAAVGACKLLSKLQWHQTATGHPLTSGDLAGATHTREHR